MHSFEMEDLIESLKKISYLMPMTYAKLQGLQLLKTQMEWFHRSCTLI